MRGRRILLLLVAVGVYQLFMGGGGGNQYQYLSDTVSSSINSVYSMGSNSTKKAMLCTVIKDPHNRYITEWADYHFALGFSRIRLYDNSVNFTLENWGRDKSYTNQVDRIHFLPGQTHIVEKREGCYAPAQSAGFMDCARTAKDWGYDWVAGLDIDEFLLIRKPGISIVDFLEQYCKYPCGQISFNWLMFGPGGRKEYRPIPVTKRFTERIANPAPVLKGIADPKALDLEYGFWMHTWIMINKTRTWVDTEGMKLRQYKTQPLRMMVNTDAPEDVAVIHHYKTLSDGEWHTKNCERKDLNGYDVQSDCIASASAIVPGKHATVIDTSAWTRLKMLVPEYARYDNLTEEELG